MLHSLFEEQRGGALVVAPSLQRGVGGDFFGVRRALQRRGLSLVVSVVILLLSSSSSRCGLPGVVVVGASSAGVNDGGRAFIVPVDVFRSSSPYIISSPLECADWQEGVLCVVCVLCAFLIELARLLLCIECLFLPVFLWQVCIRATFVWMA